MEKGGLGASFYSEESSQLGPSSLQVAAVEENGSELGWLPVPALSPAAKEPTLHPPSCFLKRAE